MTDLPPQATPAQYKALMLTKVLTALGEGADPAADYSIEELEYLCSANNVNLPIVRLPEHYFRGAKWYTNLGYVDMCNCGAQWPCPLAVDTHTAPTAVGIAKVPVTPKEEKA